MKDGWLGALTGLCLWAGATAAGAADWSCVGETVDVPGRMTVVLTTDDAGRPKAADVSLSLGASDLPAVSVGYDMDDPKSPRIGRANALVVGAMVQANPPPRAMTATIRLVIDEGGWMRPWGLYGQWRSGEIGAEPDLDVEAFTGVVPFETEASGIGAALEKGQRLAVSIEGDDGRLLGRREFALAPHREIEAMAAVAHARALKAAADPPKNCKPAAT